MIFIIPLNHTSASRDLSTPLQHSEALHAYVMGTASEHSPQAMTAIRDNEHGVLDELSLALMKITLELREQDLAHYEQSMGSKGVAIHVPFHGNTHVA